MFEVTRDTREQHGWGFTTSKVITGVTESKLDTGDYAICGLEKYLCIERKASTNEIAQNIVQKRFFKELERMQEYEHKYIICEFSYPDVLSYPINSGVPFYKQKYIKLSSEFLAKKLQEITINYNVNIVYATNKKCAEKYAEGLMKRIYEKHGQQPA